MGKGHVKIFDKKDGFQLKNFFLEAKRRKYLVLVILVICFILGLMYAISKPNMYESSVTFLPQVSASPKIGGNLSSLAALAGVKVNSSGQSGEISPVVYPKIFESINYRLLLAKTSIYTGSGQVQSLEKYCNDNYKKTSVIGSVLGSIKGLFKSSVIPKHFVLGDSIGIIKLSDSERFTLNKINELTNIQVNLDEGYIRLSSTTDDPSISAQIVSKAGEILQNKIIEIQVNRAKDQLKYLNKRLKEQEEVFKSTQLKLANFKDKNLFVSKQRSASILNQLQSDYDLAFGVYLDLAQQVEAQQLQVKKDSPIFTVLEPAVIPRQKVGPNRLAILSSFIFLGFLLSVIVIVGKQYLNYILKIN